MTKFGCNQTSSTTNRGVEAKEVEIASTRLDRNVTASSSSFPGESLPSEAAPDDASGSYVQVVVQKHRRARPAVAAQTSPRLPVASSPIRQTGEAAAAGDGNVLLLLPCPTRQPSMPHYKIVCERACSAADAADAATSARNGDRRESDALRPLDAAEVKLPKNSSWKILHNVTPDLIDLSENVPEHVEVYYFERATGACLVTSGARRAAVVEAVRRRLARAAGGWLAELLAALHLLLALPAELLIGVERAVLAAARDAVAGSVQTAADYALKPALALAFNALLQPPLVFCANVTRALREVARPVWQTVGDALEPLARALGSLRLVHVTATAPAAACRCGREPV